MAARLFQATVLDLQFAITAGGELLVVIATIAILMGLLFPVFRSVQDQANARRQRMISRKSSHP